MGPGEDVAAGNIVVKKLTVVLALVLALFSLPALAQSPVLPGEFYFDKDAATTRAFVAIPGADNEVVDRLVQVVQRKPTDVDSRVQLGSIAMKSARMDLAEELYRAALRNASSNQRVARAVRIRSSAGSPSR